MSETETVPEQIRQRLTALAAAEKQLKKPSSISFAERRDLSSKAAKAAKALQACQEGLAADAPASEEVKAALEAADTTLGKIEAAWPAAKSFTGGGQKLGQARTGAAGGSQTRPPDRIGE